jgi:hypothetical protein
MEINGIVFSIYSVRGQWKVAHCTKSGGRIGRSKVVNVASEAAGLTYATSYAEVA